MKQDGLQELKHRLSTVLDNLEASKHSQFRQLQFVVEQSANELRPILKFLESALAEHTEDDLVASCTELLECHTGQIDTKCNLLGILDRANAALAKAKPATGQETPFQAMARICGEDNAPRPATKPQPRGGG